MNLLEKRIKERFPQEQIKVLSYTKMKEPATVICMTCGTQYTQTQAQNFLCKRKMCICRNCSALEIQKLRYQEKINQKFPAEKLLITELNGAKGRIKIKCLTCGTEVQMNYGEHSLDKHKKRMCPHCFPNKREAFQNTLNNFTQNFIPNNKLFTDFEIPARCNSDTLIKATCKICGKVNYKTIHSYLKNTGCSCQGNNVKLTPEEYQKRLGVGYVLLSDYKGLEHPVLVRHQDCGFVFKSTALHVSCPKCRGSKGEQQIRYWLKENNFKYVEQYAVQIEGHLLRFDFYLPDYDIYIEYQGRQHYMPIGHFGGEPQYEKQVEYDNLKRKWAGDKLLEITYIDDILLKLNEQVARNRESSGNLLLDKEDDMF